MDDNTIRRFNRATRVKTFGETYAADFVEDLRTARDALFALRHSPMRRRAE